MSVAPALLIGLVFCIALGVIAVLASRPTAPPHVQAVWDARDAEDRIKANAERATGQPAVPDPTPKPDPSMEERNFQVGDRVVWRHWGSLAESAGVITRDMSHIVLRSGERFVDVRADNGAL